MSSTLDPPCLYLIQEPACGSLEDTASFLPLEAGRTLGGPGLWRGTVIPQGKTTGEVQPVEYTVHFSHVNASHVLAVLTILWWLSSGWKCARCDLRENLWLNLTDGSVLCGKWFFDSSGGNGHALEHYRDMGYPLAVKLGTITPDGAGECGFAWLGPHFCLSSGLRPGVCLFVVWVHEIPCLGDVDGNSLVVTHEPEVFSPVAFSKEWVKNELFLYISQLRGSKQEIG
jgi:hypothetical protein